MHHYKYFNLSEWGTRKDNTTDIKIYPHCIYSPSPKLSSIFYYHVLEGFSTDK